MKTIKCCLIIVCLFMFVGLVAAENNELDLKFVGSYVWRGMLLNDDPCFQPSLSVTAGDFGFNFWTTLDMTDAPNTQDRERIDLTVDYTKQAGISIFQAGLVSYMYYDAPSGGAEDTFEISLDYALDIPKVWIMPFVRMNYDIGEVEGYYATAGIAQAIPLEDKIWDMDIHLTVSGGDANYINYYFNPGGADESELDAGLVDVELRLSFPYVGQEGCLITPEVRYMHLLDSKVIDAAEALDRDADEIIFSLSLSVEF